MRNGWNELNPKWYKLNFQKHLEHNSIKFEEAELSNQFPPELQQLKKTHLLTKNKKKKAEMRGYEELQKLAYKSTVGFNTGLESLRKQRDDVVTNVQLAER